MRTTLTLDDDVAALLSQVQTARKLSLQQAVNAALRDGLVRMTGPHERRRRFQTKSRKTGECALPNLDNIAEVLAWTDRENYKRSSSTATS